MKEPKIKFTNIKTFEGSENIGFNADVYINGTKCLRMVDEGNGSELHLRKISNNSSTIDKKIDLLQEYIKTLPPKKDLNFELPMTMELFLDDKLIEVLEDKEQKKFNDLQKTAILFGKPNSGEYLKLQFKAPLKEIPNNTLQKHINTILENYCKHQNYRILNTNLDGFNITVM